MPLQADRRRTTTESSALEQPAPSRRSYEASDLASHHRTRLPTSPLPGPHAVASEPSASPTPTALPWTGRCVGWLDSCTVTTPDIVSAKLSAGYEMSSSSFA